MNFTFAYFPDKPENKKRVIFLNICSLGLIKFYYQGLEKRKYYACGGEDFYNCYHCIKSSLNKNI